jgi:hypothetical protein
LLLLVLLICSLATRGYTNMGFIAGANVGAGIDPMLGNYQLQGGGWQPTDDSGLYLWIDAHRGDSVIGSGNGAIDGGTVTSWYNLQAGVSLTKMQQISSQALPTFKVNGINGLPAVLFDGSTQVLSSNSATGLTSMSGLTICLVLRVLSTASAGVLAIVYTGTTPGWTARLWAGITAAGLFDPGGRRLDSDAYAGQSSGSIVVGTPYVYTLCLDYSNARMRTYLNGSPQQDIAFQTAGLSDSAESWNVQFGSVYAPTNILSYQCNMLLGEAILLKRAPTITEFTRIHGYLRNKWRIW